MQVWPDQPFAYGGRRLVLERSSDGSFELSEVKEPDTSASRRNVGEEVDAKLRKALEAIAHIQSAKPDCPMPLLGMG